MSFGALMVSSLPPALVGLCQGQAQKFGRIFGHPVWSPFLMFLTAISKTRMVCAAFLQAVYMSAVDSYHGHWEQPRWEHGNNRSAPIDIGTRPGELFVFHRLG